MKRVKKIVIETVEKFKRLGALTKVFVVVGLLLLAGLAPYGGIMLTEMPGFCATCHAMEPAENSIDRSYHDGISCGKCHKEPGPINQLRDSVVYGSESVFAQISGDIGKHPVVVPMVDSSCTQAGCHNIERLQNDPILYRKGIMFRHAPHLMVGLGEKGLKCTSCHNSIRPEEHFEITTGPCTLCHFSEQGDSEPLECRRCHALPALMGELDSNHIPIVAEEDIACTDCHGVERRKYEMVVNACDKCHADDGKGTGEFETEELHESHLGLRAPYCMDCHLPIPHAVVEE